MADNECNVPKIVQKSFEFVNSSAIRAITESFFQFCRENFKGNS